MKSGSCRPGCNATRPAHPPLLTTRNPMHPTKLLCSVALAAALSAALGSAHALPGAQDRVYTADQNSNTVSVIDPSTNTLLGQIRLGNQRPEVLSPLYKGEV